jgi:hypothetical protein
MFVRRFWGVLNTSTDALKGFVLLILRVMLTLIHAAGGVYDFRNFKEVYLCNGLSSDLQNSCIPRKTSCEYIL